jgi:hypothetical protein
VHAHADDGSTQCSSKSSLSWERKVLSQQNATTCLLRLHQLGQLGDPCILCSSSISCSNSGRLELSDGLQGCGRIYGNTRQEKGTPGGMLAASSAKPRSVKRALYIILFGEYSVHCLQSSNSGSQLLLDGVSISITGCLQCEDARKRGGVGQRLAT